jgi:hypothetical protein
MVVATSYPMRPKQPGLHHHLYSGTDPMVPNGAGPGTTKSGPSSPMFSSSAVLGALDKDIDEELLLDIPPPPARHDRKKPILSPLKTNSRLSLHATSHAQSQSQAATTWKATTAANADIGMYISAASPSSLSASSRGKGLEPMPVKNTSTTNGSTLDPSHRTYTALSSDSAVAMAGVLNTVGDSAIDGLIGGRSVKGMAGSSGKAELRIVGSGRDEKTGVNPIVHSKTPSSQTPTPTMRSTTAKDPLMTASVPSLSLPPSSVPSPDATNRQQQKKAKKKKTSRIESFHHAILTNMKETDRIRRAGSFLLPQNNPQLTNQNSNSQPLSSSSRKSHVDNSSTTAALFTETMYDISLAASSTMQTLKSAIQHANSVQQQQNQPPHPQQQQRHQPQTQRRRANSPASVAVGSLLHSSSDGNPRFSALTSRVAGNDSETDAAFSSSTLAETGRMRDFESRFDITDKACSTNCKGKDDDSIDVEHLPITASKAVKEGTQILRTDQPKDQRHSVPRNSSPKISSSDKITSSAAAPCSVSDSSSASVIPSELSHLVAKWCGLPVGSNDRGTNKGNISNNHWVGLEHPHMMKSMHDAVLKVVTNVDGQLQQSFGTMTHTETEPSERRNIETRDVWAKLAGATGAPTEVRTSTGTGPGAGNNASASNHGESHLYWAFTNAFHNHDANNDDDDDDERTVGTLDTWQDENSQLRRLGSWGTIGSNFTSGTGATYGTYDTAGTGATGSVGIIATKHKPAGDTTSMPSSSEEEDIGRFVLQDDSGHVIDPILLEKAQKSRDRRISAAAAVAAASAAAAAASSSSGKVDTNTTKRKAKKKRRQKVVQFDYPPIKSLRQYTRPDPEDLPNLFFTEHELDQIEEDRFSTMSTDDIEIVAVSSKLSSSQDENEMTDAPRTSRHSRHSVSSVAERRDSPCSTKHNAVDPPANVASPGLKSVRGRNGTPHRCRPHDGLNGFDEYQDAKQQNGHQGVKSPVGNDEKVSRKGSGRLVKGVQIYLRERSTGA